MESKQRLLEPQLVQTGRADQFSRKVFCDGMRDGVPIALGYFAVSFSLGIAARKAGFTPFQGFLFPVCRFRLRVCRFQLSFWNNLLSKERIDNAVSSMRSFCAVQMRTA